MKKADNVHTLFESAESASKTVKLKAFSSFKDSKEALSAATALVELKLDKNLKKFLKKNIVSKEISDKLAVADAKLGGVIKKKLGVDCVANDVTMEILRGIRSQSDNLIDGLTKEHATQMA